MDSLVTQVPGEVMWEQTPVGTRGAEGACEEGEAEGARVPVGSGADGVRIGGRVRGGHDGGCVGACDGELRGFSRF
ncbi:hypothetical protein E2562_026792 [Oryza meyeriana var. granulata]|uniref:Uncharacterized protein n=1 Tax=Oryza meyeriana var. granulata TaxID=110450 RepID=A0A6G1CTY7_9ORYZ|nr:hypothetical protein E2562_026792 [Oryza meyeriana var. granulata]